MHDEEPDTFVPESMPERVARMLSEIGVESSPHALGEGKYESGEYYNRHFSSAPRMVTNRGSLEIRGSNIDAVQVIQKG